MPKVCFFKELANMQVFIQGRPAPFELIPGNHGTLTLESPKDDEMIAALTAMSEKGRGGVVKVSEEELERKKKAAFSLPSKQQKKEYLRPIPKGPFDRKAGDANAAKPEPPPPPSPEGPAPLTRSAQQKLSGEVAPTTPAAAEPTAPAYRPPTRRVGRPRKNPVEEASVVP